MLDLFSDPEDGADILFRNIRIFPQLEECTPKSNFLFFGVFNDAFSMKSTCHVVETDFEGIPAFAWRDGRKPRETAAVLANDLLEIRTEHLLNTIVERYLQTNLFDKILLWCCDN
jgi:hypothetical protein